MTSRIGSFAEDDPEGHEAVRLQGLRELLRAQADVLDATTEPVALLDDDPAFRVYDVGPAESYSEESITARRLGATEVIVIRQGSEFFAMADRCTHQRYPLNDGELLEGKIRCVHHGATFDLRTGKPTLPAVVKIKLFQVDEVDGRVVVSVQER